MQPPNPYIALALTALLLSSSGVLGAPAAGRAVLPVEGRSALPAIAGESLPERALGFDHQGAHALRRGQWKIVWSKRMPREIRWELYDLSSDRSETRDLAKEHPERLAAMVAEWERWSERVGVTWEPRW